MRRGAYLLNLGSTPYLAAWELQRALAAAVSQGAVPDTVIFVEHPPVITLGRRTDGDAEVHVPADAEVEIVETDRGGKSTYHGPGQLVCYPILDLTRHGEDVKKYCRDLEEALIRTLAAVEVEEEGDQLFVGVVADKRRVRDRAVDAAIDAGQGRCDLVDGAVQVVHSRLERDREIHEVVLAAAEEHELGGAHALELAEQVEAEPEADGGRSGRADRDPFGR